ncbi:MAG TPA: DUF4082 domain-containing protein, partial [Phycisphaerae bacterium]|nr:DUF4082 domain-containing protein [Phycisphaerae bacterium]
MKHRLSWFLLLSGALLSAPLSFGAGHPILLVGNSSNPFSYYYSEILHAEGLNTFDSADLSSVTATTLSSYDVVILGEGALTSAQATMFTTWVNGGGNLIAMRPDKQLASLLGLTSTGGTLANEYLLVNTGTAPGAGIVGQTIQFHGPADLYTLSGASAVATLYSSATASTAYPAVSLRLGAGAGNAAAFTFDLARSVVYTRQGNPAWAGEARIGQGGPIRSTDLYYGAATFDPEPDWVDRNNIAIPQADEQQRLLVNLILYLNQTRKPLPRFWYLPFGKKAAVVMTGDDHGNNGTAGRFNDYLANSPAGCSVANWECVRATTYMYPNTPLPNAQAATFAAQGFELAVHLTTDCADFTPTSLEATYVSQLSAFQTAFPSLAAPITNRTHCIAWSDWGTQFQVERNHGIRFDTNYYFWPPSWVTSTPGFFTGSGIPMRFAQADGTIVDIYQAPTQMTDESGQSYPSTVTGLLNNAVGSAGFYGVFTANMHNDFNNCGTSCPDGETSEVSAEQIVAAAQSAGVPVVSAQQMLQWLDGRNGSSFDSVSWTGSALQFTITAASGANGLQAMLPAAFAAGGLSAITLAGSPVTYSLSTIKGIQYAVFTAAAGTYQATYATVLPPSISAVTATPGSSTATITWTTDKSSTSRVDYGISAGALTSTQSNSALVTSHSVTLTGLTSPTVYYFRVTSVDAGGNSSTSPATSGSPATFATITPTPPVISAILATPALNGTAVISWTTDKASNSRVDYGTSTALGSTVSDAGMVTAHGITLSGLTIGTTYYFRVTSADPLGDTASAPTSPSSFVENGGISVWSASTTPGTIDAGDTNSVELGMKFRSDVAGIVTGVRFYKAPTNTGTHIGNLWSSTGTLLATVTFTNETSYGWQQANFATPVSIAANTTYVVSYFAPAGHYSASSGYFTSAGANNAPLHALQSGVDGSNGLYRYVTASAFPNSSWSDTNYWVDLAFTDNVPPVISSLTAATTIQTATITWTTSEPATSRLDYGTTTSLGTTVTDGTMLTAHSFTLSGLTTGTKYYYRVTSVDGFGNSTTSPVTTNSPATF